ncbi:hypothetical protein [Phytohabitans rumicis]|uniref:hypothetical protein n=1 Tax=Phytohabitans rumicis TaxID=1076125 RepID=UPI001C498BA5|nr:hypothetical protein [Phytohabitans rumicis]
MISAALAMQPELPPRLFDADLWDRLHGLVRLVDFTSSLPEVELLITGWGARPSPRRCSTRRPSWPRSCTPAGR